MSLCQWTEQQLEQLSVSFGVHYECVITVITQLLFANRTGHTRFDQVVTLPVGGTGGQCPRDGQLVATTHGTNFEFNRLRGWLSFAGLFIWWHGGLRKKRREIKRHKTKENRTVASYLLIRKLKWLFIYTYLI